MTASTNLTAMLPAHRLERVRLGVTGFGVLLCLLPLAQVSVEPGQEAGSAVAVTSGVALVAWTVFGHVRSGRIPAALLPVPVVFVLLMGIGLADPTSVIYVCLGVVASQTMSGTLWTILLRLLGLMAVVPLSVLFSISRLGETPALSGAHALASLSILPLFTGLIYLLRRTIERQAVAITQEGFMARLSSGLLASVTVQDINQVMVNANRQLDQLSPGLITLYLVRVAPGEPGEPGSARVLNAHGAEAVSLPDFLPASALSELPPIGTEREVSLRTGSYTLTELGLPKRNWHALTLEQAPGAPCDLVLHGVKSIVGQNLSNGVPPEEVEFLDVLRRMRRLWRLATNRVQALDAVLAAEDRDGVTGLPDRSTTKRRSVALARADPDRFGLILLQIYGLDLVEAERGVAGTDAAMVQLANRIIDVVGEAAFVGRNGDNSFAVVLPDVGSNEEMLEIVDRLADVIHQPVPLPTGAVQLSLRTSIARTNETCTAADLLERDVRALLVTGHEQPRGADSVALGQA